MAATWLQNRLAKILSWSVLALTSSISLNHIFALATLPSLLSCMVRSADRKNNRSRKKNAVLQILNTSGKNVLEQANTFTDGMKNSPFLLGWLMVVEKSINSRLNEQPLDSTHLTYEKVVDFFSHSFVSFFRLVLYLSHVLSCRTHFFFSPFARHVFFSLFTLFSFHLSSFRFSRYISSVSRYAF